MNNNTMLNELREISLFLTCIEILTSKTEIPCSTLNPLLVDANQKLTQWINSYSVEHLKKAEVIQLKPVGK